MKLSHYAKKIGISYRRAWERHRRGQIPGALQIASGTAIVPDSAIASIAEASAMRGSVRAAIVARSSMPRGPTAAWLGFAINNNHAGKGSQSVAHGK